MIPYKRYASRTQVPIHSVTLLVKEHTSTVMSPTTSPHSKDVYVRGHTSFAEETIRVQLYDGYEWGEWTDVNMTSGTNLAP